MSKLIVTFCFFKLHTSLHSSVMTTNDKLFCWRTVFGKGSFIPACDIFILSFFLSPSFCSPPLTQFFVECGGLVRTDKKPALCKSYQKLVSDLWHKNRYLVIYMTEEWILTCLHATVGIQGRFHYHPSRIVRCLENDANNVYKRWMQVTFQTWKSWIISSGQQGQFLCVIIKEFVLSALISLQH